MAWISLETRKYLKEIGTDLWYYSGLSFSIAISIILGLAAGYFLDQSLGTSPMWTLIGLVLGIGAGFWNIYIAMRKVQRMK